MARPTHLKISIAFEAFGTARNDFGNNPCGAFTRLSALSVFVVGVALALDKIFFEGAFQISGRKLLRELLVDLRFLFVVLFPCVRVRTCCWVRLVAAPDE